jgi:hypothetical protein
MRFRKATFRNDLDLNVAILNLRTGAEVSAISHVDRPVRSPRAG